jgi:hypothetical protein
MGAGRRGRPGVTGRFPPGGGAAEHLHKRDNKVIVALSVVITNAGIMFGDDPAARQQFGVYRVLFAAD